MLSRREYLLVCLAEECAEIQQAIAKILRFGAENHAPNTTHTNLNQLMTELSDCMAIIELLQEDDLFAAPFSRELINEKKRKVNMYMPESVAWGTLAPDAPLDS